MLGQPAQAQPVTRQRGHHLADVVVVPLVVARGTDGRVIVGVCGGGVLSLRLRLLEVGVGDPKVLVSQGLG